MTSRASSVIVRAAAVLVEATRGNVRVDVSGYSRELQEFLDELVLSAKRHTDRMQSSTFDVESLRRDVKEQLGAKWAECVDVNASWEKTRALSTHLSDLMQSEGGWYPLWDRVYNFRNWLTAQGEDTSGLEDESKRTHKRLVDTTRRDANKVAHQVQSAIDRIPSWQSRRVTITPSFDPTGDEAITESPGVYVVTIATGYREGYDPTIELIVDDDMRVQHVESLEIGDPDFFKDASVASDYSKLVKELVKPGSSSRGKDLVVWTARPTKDRKLFTGAREVPTGLFVTNDEHRAYGIAHDLGGREVRDVWRLVINDVWLVETLKAGRVRDFQVVGQRTAPVKSLDLVFEGGQSLVRRRR